MLRSTIIVTTLNLTLLASCGANLKPASTSINQQFSTSSPPSTSAVEFSSGQDASVVIGQSNFYSNLPNQGGGNPAGNTMNTPDGISILSGETLFIGEYLNNRYLIYNSLPTTNDAFANSFFGQPDANSGVANNPADIDGDGVGPDPELYMKNGRSVAWNGNQFFMTDGSNNRILVWNSRPTSKSQKPNFVIGQPNFTTFGNACTANGLDNHYGAIFAEANRLIVSDVGHNRVLVFNLPITANQPSAALVIGQINMTTCDGNVSTNLMNGPAQAIIVNGKLIVADRYNSRVLVFNSVPTTNGASADAVIGQADLISGSPNRGATTASNTLHEPHSIAVDEKGHLYIADTYNHRIVIYNSIPTDQLQNLSGSIIIGQPSQTGHTPNNGGISAATLSRPTAVGYVNKSLIVADQGNHRVLIFKNR